MFAAGSEIGSQTGREIVGQDQKFYEERERRFAVSQVEMVGFESFWDRADELRAVLDDVRSAHDLSFAALMVTDITTSTTLLLFRGPDRLPPRRRIGLRDARRGQPEEAGLAHAARDRVKPLRLNACSLH